MSALEELTVRRAAGKRQLFRHTKRTDAERVFVANRVKVEGKGDRARGAAVARRLPALPESS